MEFMIELARASVVRAFATWAGRRRKLETPLAASGLEASSQGCDSRGGDATA
ncbi:hypothetical protein [Variovorax sp. dw_308]|uniref:hypothetical protein n=1 Tax=Variovorax sp. dw_308 TaxID=2721546 RepID=UPI001C460484|nr:hypothetical protein [Variovorax sp. dw_308]